MISGFGHVVVLERRSRRRQSGLTTEHSSRKPRNASKYCLKGRVSVVEDEGVHSMKGWCEKLINFFRRGCSPLVDQPFHDAPEDGVAPLHGSYDPMPLSRAVVHQNAQLLSRLGREVSGSQAMLQGSPSGFSQVLLSSSK